MDESYAPQPLARWYVFGAAASLIFMALLCVAYAVHLGTDPAALPLDERALFEAEPVWVSGAFGLTGIAGAIGAILLLLRRKAAEGLLCLSLVGSVLWLAGLLLVPRLRDLLMTGEIVAALVVTALVWTIFWFARHSRQRGWLR